MALRDRRRAWTTIIEEHEKPWLWQRKHQGPGRSDYSALAARARVELAVILPTLWKIESMAPRLVSASRWDIPGSFHDLRIGHALLRPELERNEMVLGRLGSKSASTARANSPLLEGQCLVRTWRAASHVRGDSSIEGYVLGMNEKGIPPASDLLHWLRQAGAVIADGPISVRKEHGELLIVLFGACMQTIRYGEAYADLWNADRRREAVPIARSALEHVVTAQWVFHRGEAALMQAQARQKAFDFYDFMASYLGNEELGRDALQLVDERERLPRFQQLMADIDLNGFLASSYRQMSQVTHVTGATVIGFAQFDGRRYELVGSPDDPHALVNLYVTSNAVMMASWLLSELIEGIDSAALDEIAERLRLVQTAVADD